MFKTFAILWVLAGLVCWCGFDAKYFARMPVAALAWLVIDTVAGPLAWLRIFIPKS